VSPVKLIWITPDAEQLISDMARVSAPENRGLPPGKLLAYCVRKHHWSIFEMVNACIEITTTRDIARQILRHRSFSYQEFSQRYATVDKLPEAPLREARLQDHENRQNSIATEDTTLDLQWRLKQEQALQATSSAYQWALKNGIAKEVARSVLPEGLTSSRMYMNGNLRSWMHFVQLRSGNGTQFECQLIAQAIGKELAKHFPQTWEALLKNN
jgi:thymidylate synthase (FAD)